MYKMAKAVTKRKFYIIIMGSAMFLLLITSCRSDGSYDTSDTANRNDLPTILSTLSGLDDIELVRAFTSSTNPNSGIWVNGRGNARGAPDLAIVNLGVETLGNTATNARADAATAIDGTIAVLRENGIADSDIQTRFFNISPRYNSIEVTRCLDEAEEEPVSVSPAVETPAPPRTMAETGVLQEKLQAAKCWATYEQVLTGYQVNNQLTVKVHDLDSLGTIIDEAIEASGDLTRVDGINFAIEDSKKLQDEARVAAIKDLQDKARHMASLAGVELGHLTFITESGAPAPAQFARFESHTSFAAATAPQTAIQMGQLDVVVTVQGVFEIGNRLP